MPYNSYMKLVHEISKSQAPPAKSTRIIALVYAAILTVMVTAQLIKFHEFIPLVESFWLPGGESTAILFASLIVVMEIFALPFLLGMPISKLMIAVSVFSGWFVAAAWLVVSLYLIATVNVVVNAGFFGAGLVNFPTGWVAVVFSLILCVFALWATWGAVYNQRAAKLEPAE